MRPEDLGRARRAWVDKDYLGVSGGRGDPRAVRTHLTSLRAAYARSQRDTEARQNLRRRIGKLLGGAATLWIGAATEAEMEPRKALAERTAESLRAALIEGVLTGRWRGLPRLSRKDFANARQAQAARTKGPHTASWAVHLRRRPVPSFRTPAPMSPQP